MSAFRRALVVTSDQISHWIEKGEVVDGYYNPMGYFDRLDLLLVNDDRPDPAIVSRLAGGAEIEVHNVAVEDSLYRRTAGFQPRLLRGWARSVVDLARHLEPDLVRCYGAALNAFAASEIQRQLGTPYAVSLHINPDADVHGRAEGLKQRLVSRSMRRIERYSLRRADIVLPVYEPIVPYLKRLGVSRYEVAYNMVSGEHLRTKKSYELSSPARVISVGRQFDAKDPSELIRAVAAMDGVVLTLVGNGPAHESLRDLARSSGAGDRIEFLPSVANEDLCSMLPDFDIFATHTEYWELSKAVIEALLAGLPVLLNRRTGGPVPELQDGLCAFTENTAAAWGQALERLLTDRAAREQLGRDAQTRASELWAPEQTAAHFAEIYARLVERS